MKTPLLGSHIGLASAASSVPASGATYDPTASGLIATDLQAAIDEIQAEIAAGVLTIEDEGTPLASAATSLDFVGAGVTASGAGATKTITIPGGGRTFTFFGA